VSVTQGGEILVSELREPPAAPAASGEKSSPLPVPSLGS
jgi:hypothetical protein